MNEHTATATADIKQPLPKSGREIVSDLEDKALVNAEHYYHNVMGEDWMSIYDFYQAILPGHSRIARRFTNRLIRNGNLEVNRDDDTLVRKNPNFKQ